MAEVGTEQGRYAHYQSSPKCLFDSKKRKCGFGSAEKERKRQSDRQGSYVGYGWGSQESLEIDKRNNVSLSQEEYPELNVLCDSMFDKPFGGHQRNSNWADAIEDEENHTVSGGGQENKTHIKYRKRLALSEIQKPNNKKATHKPKIQSPKSQSSSPKSRQHWKEKPLLTDPHKLRQRQKQIDIGKNTLGYGRYMQEVPRDKRKKDDPQTPNKYQVCSTRSWQGQMKLWRRCLHIWDPSQFEEKDDPFTTSISFNSEGDVVESDSAAEESISTGSQESIEDESFEHGLYELNEADLFKNLDLDSCLSNDGFPL